MPLPALPPEPTHLDPPLELPVELRPLRCRRRYLRTIQLLDDPDPVTADDQHSGGHDWPTSNEHRRVSRARPSSEVRSKANVPFEDTLRRELPSPTGQKSRTKLLKATSHADLRLSESSRVLGASSRRDAKSSSGQQIAVVEAQGRRDGDDNEDGSDDRGDDDEDDDERSPDTDDQVGDLRVPGGGNNGASSSSLASQVRNLTHSAPVAYDVG